MKIIVLSGGSGKRLWPLSSDEQPKHLLQLLTYRNKKESMLQRVIRQITTLVDKEDIIIATTEQQFDTVVRQVPDVIVIKEPDGRDTFPAIALACSYIISNFDVNEDEVVTVVSADTYTDLSFYEKIIVLSHLIKKKKISMGLVGVKPSMATSKFGYMVPKTKDDLFTIEKFVEKPELNIAEELVNKGALWNSGVFVFPLKTVLNVLIDRRLPTNYSDFIECFSNLPKRSFDYEVIEALKDIVAIQYDGEWEDLGTWEVLLNKIDLKISGNVTMSTDCEEISIINDLDIPIKLLGTSDLTIVATKNGILISNKNETSRLKEIL
ncbi:sugar phosphate nucleotidyltransferase [Lysinibacillus fusiformis]|uniref:sugar phosphate nucleotidyltransferase n=1 Tax=Lysinibacillus fusiformis TaxID=28031 RepID=UPI00148C5D24|nr:sugar phosphate nucleotidyltransferase [Lysinibacillus fusiformis]NOG29146.1 mannose-1-phosphate guanylyltransferase [Lysinibacillus fusiformis]